MGKYGYQKVQSPIRVHFPKYLPNHILSVSVTCLFDTRKNNPLIWSKEKHRWHHCINVTYETTNRQLTNQPTISAVYTMSPMCRRFGFLADCTLASELFAKRARSAQKDREGRPEMDTRSPRRRPEIRKDTKWKGTSWDTLRYQLLIIFLVAFVALNCVTSPLQ